MQSLRSTDRGTKTIDHILTQGISQTHVTRTGQLPFGLGFSSDHQALFADFKADEVLHLHMEEAAICEGRRLSSQNKKHRDKYIESLMNSLNSDNIFERVGKLHEKAMQGVFDKHDLEEFNKVDTSVTSAMIASEKKLPRRRNRIWTTELGRLIHQARYFCLLLRWSKGIAYNNNILANAKAKAGVDEDLSDESEILSRLRSTWSKIDDIKKNEQVERDKHLENLAQVSGGGETQKIVKMIRYRERTKWRFQRIRKTLRRVKTGGLAGVDVPVYGEDGSISGWKSITGSNSLHEKLVERNRTHLSQATPTPLGHGQGYDLFHGPDRHKTAEAVLRGELDWEHPMEEVNKFIAQLKTAHDPEELAEEIAKINGDITAEEFRFYFKKKEESTESLPSGRHVGHYKAILHHDSLVDLHVAILNNNNNYFSYYF